VEVREALVAQREARAAALEIRERRVQRVAAELREEAVEPAEPAPGLIPTQGIRAKATRIFPTLPWT